MLVALVHKVKETPYNLDVIFKAVKLGQIEFRLTGDCAFAMPCFGLNKGCSSTHPCPLCDRERTKVGGKGSRWLEGEVNLRRLDLFQPTTVAGWRTERGRRQPAAGSGRV